MGPPAGRRGGPKTRARVVALSARGRRPPRGADGATVAGRAEGGPDGHRPDAEVADPSEMCTRSLTLVLNATRGIIKY